MMLWKSYGVCSENLEFLGLFRIIVSFRNMNSRRDEDCFEIYL